MKNFKPKGNGMKVSPEAHSEWSDKEGKHSSVGIKGYGVSMSGENVIKKNARSFDPGAGVKTHEAAQVTKSHGGGRGKPAFPSYSGSSGHKTGPQKHAGKGAEGSTKGPGGAGKLNHGNGISGGKKTGLC